MPNYAYWKAQEHWTLTQAVFLLCRDTPSAEREGERPTDEHRAAEALLKANVAIIEVAAPPSRSVLTGQPHPPRLTPGVRVKEVMTFLRAQTVVVWGSDLIKADGSRPRQPSRPRKPGETHRQREESMRRYLEQTLRSTWIRLTHRKQWHKALRDFESKLWSVEPDTFDRFWQNRAQDLKDAVQLKDKSSM